MSTPEKHTLGPEINSYVLGGATNKLRRDSLSQLYHLLDQNMPGNNMIKYPDIILFVIPNTKCIYHHQLYS